MQRITFSAHISIKWLILYKFWTLPHKEVQQQQLSQQSLNVSPIRARILGHLHRDSFDCYFTPFRGCVWKCSASTSPWDTRPPPPLAHSACWGVAAGWKLDKAPPISQPPTLHPLSHTSTTPIIIFFRGLALEQEGGASVIQASAFTRRPSFPIHPPRTQLISATNSLSHTCSILWWQKHALIFPFSCNCLIMWWLKHENVDRSALFV